MLAVVIGLFCLILGLLIGFYARDMRDKLKDIYTNYKEERFLRDAGPVKPERTRGPTRSQPIDLSSDTGPVMRPTPDEIIVANMKEREKKLSGQG